jgi:UDP-galactopyranose mutase
MHTILNPFSSRRSSDSSANHRRLVKPALALVIGAFVFAYLFPPLGNENTTEVILRASSSSKHTPAQHQQVQLPKIKGVTVKMDEKKKTPPIVVPAQAANTYDENNDDDDDDPFSKKYDNCIVGAGLSGSVIAENYATKLGQTSLIIEKRTHIGGNCYDYIDEETGIRVSRFGAHLFHTRHERVWNYVQQFAEWVPYEHKVLGVVNGKYVPIPVTIDTVNILFDENITTTEEMDEWLKNEQITTFPNKNENEQQQQQQQNQEATNSEEVALMRVGPRLYDLIFKPYTFKQWAKYPAELGPEVLARIPVRNNHDGRYFSDPHQALPKNGYTAIFEKMLSSPKITVVTDTDYFEVKDKIKCKRLYYTGPVDTYFADLGWPKLEYRSLSFERVVKDNTPGFFQPASVVNHPQATDVNGNEVDFTRIVEYKHLLNQTSDKTIYFIERSKDGGEPYYPVPNDENKNLYKRYQEMAEKEEGVTFVGRLANYKYFNMDDAILNALELFDKDTKDISKTAT